MINLDDDRVFAVEYTVAKIRDFFDDGEPLDDFITALDNAQAEVFDGKLNEAYVVIRIK